MRPNVGVHNTDYRPQFVAMNVQSTYILVHYCKEQFVHMIETTVCDWRECLSLADSAVIVLGPKLGHLVQTTVCSCECFYLHISVHYNKEQFELGSKSYKYYRPRFVAVNVSTRFLVHYCKEQSEMGADSFTQ